MARSPPPPPSPRTPVRSLLIESCLPTHNPPSHPIHNPPNSPPHPPSPHRSRKGQSLKSFLEEHGEDLSKEGDKPPKQQQPVQPPTLPVEKAPHTTQALPPLPPKMTKRRAEEKDEEAFVPQEKAGEGGGGGGGGGGGETPPAGGVGGLMEELEEEVAAVVGGGRLRRGGGSNKGKAPRTGENEPDEEEEAVNAKPGTSREVCRSPKPTHPPTHPSHSRIGSVEGRETYPSTPTRLEGKERPTHPPTHPPIYPQDKPKDGAVEEERPECTGGTVYSDCGRPCTATCEHPRPVCPAVCQKRCHVRPILTHPPTYL